MMSLRSDQSGWLEALATNVIVYCIASKLCLKKLCSYFINLLLIEIFIIASNLAQ